MGFVPEHKNIRTLSSNPKGAILFSKLKKCPLRALQRVKAILILLLLYGLVKVKFTVS